MISGTDQIICDSCDRWRCSPLTFSQIDWLALATARAGFVVGDAWMLYGKGGIAIAQEQHTAVAGQHFNGITTAFNHAGSAIHTGAVIGAGAEYAFAPNWSVKGNSRAATSHHTSGVMVAFADGHVQFVPNSVDIHTWMRMGTRNGGEVVTVP